MDLPRVPIPEIFLNRHAHRLRTRSGVMGPRTPGQNGNSQSPNTARYQGNGQRPPTQPRAHISRGPNEARRHPSQAPTPGHRNNFQTPAPARHNGSAPGSTGNRSNHNHFRGQTPAPRRNHSEAPTPSRHRANTPGPNRHLRYTSHGPTQDRRNNGQGSNQTQSNGNGQNQNQSRRGGNPRRPNQKLSSELESEIADRVELYIELGFPVKDGLVWEIASAVLHEKGMDNTSKGWPKSFLSRYTNLRSMFFRARDTQKAKQKARDEQRGEELSPSRRELNAAVSAFPEQAMQWIRKFDISLDNIYVMGELAFITKVVKAKKRMTMTRNASDYSRPFISGVFCMSHQRPRFLSPFVTCQTEELPTNGPIGKVHVTQDKTGWASMSTGLKSWLKMVFDAETQPRAADGASRPWRLLFVDADHLDRIVAPAFYVSCWYRRILCLPFPTGTCDRLSPLHLTIFDAFEENFFGVMRKKWRRNREENRKEEFSLRPEVFLREFSEYIVGLVSSREYETKAQSAWSESRLLPDNPAPSRERPHTEDVIVISDEESNRSREATRTREPTNRRSIAIEVPNRQMASPPQSSPMRAQVRPVQVKQESSESEESEDECTPAPARTAERPNKTTPRRTEEPTPSKRPRTPDETPSSRFGDEQAAQRKRLRRLTECTTRDERDRQLEKLLDFHMNCFLDAEAGRGILASMKRRVSDD